MNWALSVNNLSVQYQEKIILESVSFSIPYGSIAAIVGPNGAGKSTLIKTILGFTKKTTGTISFSQKTEINFGKKIAYIPQKSSIDFDFPVTVYDVVLMGRYPHLFWYQSLQKVDYEKTEAAIDFVGLGEYKDTPISNLSGGQQQLCFIARALCQDAEFFILDEPFVGVDAPGEKKIIVLLKQLTQEGKTVMIVHHDLVTLSSYFDWIVFLNKTVISYGSTDRLLADESFLQKTYTRLQRAEKRI